MGYHRKCDIWGESVFEEYVGKRVKINYFVTEMDNGVEKKVSRFLNNVLVSEVSETHVKVIGNAGDPIIIRKELIDTMMPVREVKP